MDKGYLWGFIFWVLILVMDVYMIINSLRGIVKKDMMVPVTRNSSIEETGLKAIYFGIFYLTLSVIVFLLILYMGWTYLLVH